MPLNEMEKAQVRQFLESQSAKRWIEHCIRSLPKLELGKYPMDVYNASMSRREHWREAFEFAQSCVQEDPRPVDYGPEPIDNSRD